MSAGLICAYWSIISAQSWRMLIGFILVYACAGMVWSIFRWYRWVRIWVARYKSKNADGQLSSHDMSYLKDHLDAGEHKSMIVGWIGYWPWSLFWNFTGDFFTMCFEALQQVYSSISSHGLKQFTEKPERSDRY